MFDVVEFKPHRRGSGYNTVVLPPTSVSSVCRETRQRPGDLSATRPWPDARVKREEEKKVKPSQQLRGNTVQSLRDLANCAGEAESYGV